ncbi:MAG: phenylalanine--tRNA ligase subunit beta [Candidatus Methanomethylophilaceae archaeon]|nr:phenylalanine--tRNA ligase subunit beta [Candidatus Methanomethylophilaceae archaeon]MDY0224461.1 phenylalanine--tRNA ligase subunit beta [Candidatus Methanomethylophilaceae archaeon]
MVKHIRNSDADIMPVINFKYEDLCSLIGEKVPQQTLIQRIPLIGADMHDTEGNEDEMSVEFFPDRPDLFSVEGLARGMRAFLDIKPGMQEYDVKKTDIVVTADESVRNIRPYFLCAAVFDVNISDEFLRSMMELQEKLHITIGRKRNKFAIGIHDLDKVQAPFTYTTVKPDEVRFVPLAKTESMTMAEILTEHEKGVDYAHLLKGLDRYPVIFDKNKNVLSFPPIINGALTTVTTNTHNLFIDVTGNDRKAVKGALDIVVTALAERGGKIGSVLMKGTEECISPDLSVEKYVISVKECDKFIGVDLGSEGIIEALRRMEMNAFVDSEDTDAVHVCIPSTRLDIMHKADIFEDVAIGYGFDKFGGSYKLNQTMGHLSADTTFSESMRDIMIGLGFTEVTTLTLSNDREEFQISGLPEMQNVRVTNPITEEHTCLRSYLMPSLMRILRHNKHRDLPQKIFEVGYVIRDNKVVLHLCALATASKTSFTEIKSIAESVLRETSTKYSLSPCDYSTFIDGRGAFVNIEGKDAGLFGEVSPKVVVDFEITHPVIMLELDLTPIILTKANSLF